MNTTANGVINNINNVIINLNVVGMKLGDVNWDYNPALARMPSKVFIKPIQKGMLNKESE